MLPTVPVITPGKTHKGLAVVAFIDLLGFSANINEHWHDPTNNPLDVIQQLKKDIRTERKIGLVTAHFEGAVEYSPPRVTTVSDSIVIVHKLDKPSLVDFLGAFTTVMAAVSNAVNLAAKAGYAARGAVELGHVFWDEDEIIGPCFNAAYYLESKVAKTARIVMGPNALQVLKLNWKVNHTDVLIGGSFYVSSDGLVAIRPDQRAEADYRQFKKDKPTFSEKYDEFISHCHFNTEYRLKYGELTTGIEKLESLGCTVDPKTVPPVAV